MTLRSRRFLIENREKFWPILALLPLVAPAQIVITPATLPTGQVNTAYSQQLNASGGTGPYTFTLLSGSLPSGKPKFALSAAGLIAGTPNGCKSLPCANPDEPMNSAFTVQATDAVGATGTQSYTIGVYWNPTEATFLANVSGDDANLTAGLTNFTPPAFGAHLDPAAPEFRQAATDNQATWNAWVDGFHASGATIVNIEPDLDCVFNNVTSCLALYSGVISYAHSLGMWISLNPAFFNRQACGGAGCSPKGPATSMAADCRALIGHKINATPGNGVSDWFACLTTPIPALGMSAYQWMVANWLADGDRFVPVHEPTSQPSRWGEGYYPGGCNSEVQPSQPYQTCSGATLYSPGGSGNTCPQDWVTNFLLPLLNPSNGLLNSWIGAAGIHIRIGVTTLRYEESDFNPTFSDVFAQNLPTSVDMGYDIYTFDPSNLSTYVNSIASAHQLGHQIYFEEFAPPYWLQSGADGAEQCAIKGCYSCDFQTSQSDQNFVEAFLSFAASQGALSASLFSAQILAGCSTTQPTNCLEDSVIAQASSAFLAGNRSPVSQRLASILTPGGDLPAAIAKTAGDEQITAPGQPFPLQLSVSVTDAGGNPVPGAGVTFTVIPGLTAAAGVFAALPAMPILTDLYGNATSPVLTANDTGGPFTVIASVNGFTATFTLSNVGYALASTSATVGSIAGNGAVLLSGYGPWTAVSNTSWLHIADSSAGGSGSALIAFSYDANPSPSAQVGTLTIAGLTFTVTQAGTAYQAVSPLTALVTSGLNLPQAVAVDAQGNVYIADTANNAIKQWNAATQQVVALVSDGLSNPAGVAVDGSGNVYFADTGNSAIKEWNASTQQVATLVSTGVLNPHGIAVDGQGNVYIADTGDNAIAKWSAANQQLTVLVSSGLNAPQAVAVDGQGNLYIADTGNNAVEQWSSASRQVTALVSAGLNSPQGIAVDGQANVYIADTGNNVIKQWSAATQQLTTLSASGFSAPSGLALDSSGNLYLADTNHGAIDQLTLAYLALGATSLNEGAASGSDAVSALVLPLNAAVQAMSDQSWLTVTAASSGAINFAFQANHSVNSRIAHIAVLGQQITVTQAGDVPSAMTKTSGDSQSALAGQVFVSPLQVTITDAAGNPVQSAPVTFNVTPGAGGASGMFSPAPSMPVLTDRNGNATAPALAANGVLGSFTVTASSGSLAVTFSLSNSTYILASNSALVGSTAGGGSVLLIGNGPWTATSNASWLHLANGSISGTASAAIPFTYDANSNPAAQTGTLTIAGLTYSVTQAGAGYVPVFPVTTLVSAGLNAPRGLALDGQGNVYFADSANNAIKQWNSAGLATTLISSGLNNPSGVAVDAYGNVYIADSGNNAIEQWSAANQQVTPLIASGLNNPSGIAVDAQGNLYIADTGNQAVEEWSAAAGQLTVLVNSGLNNPSGIAVDAQGNVYIADAGANTIVEWSAATQQVTTLPISGLSAPSGIAVDGQGNLSIADTGNNAIKQFNATTGQLAVLAPANAPAGVALDQRGSVYLSDTGNNAIRELTPAYLALGASAVSEGAAAGADSITAQVLPSSVPLLPSSDQPWLAIGGVSNGAIQFSFTANETLSSRAAHITVLGQQVTVTQANDSPAAIAIRAGNSQSALTGQLFAVPLQVKVTDAGGNPVQGATVTFALTPGPGGASGILAGTATAITDQKGHASAPLLSANSIVGAFSVTAGVNSLTATFSLANLGFLLAANSATVNSDAGAGSVQLIGSGSWTASSNVSWLHIADNNSSGVGGALIPFSYDANLNPAAQTGTLTVAGLTFTVTQAGTNYTRVSPVTPLVTSGLTLPRAVAVDAQGNVYIADTGGNAIRKWVAATRQMFTLVSTGLSGPAGVAVDAAGNVYIADTGNNAVELWSAATHQVTTLVAGLNGPAGVAVDRQDNVYIADTGNHVVKLWNAATQQLTTLAGSGLTAPAALSVDGQGNVYIADTGNNAIELWSAANQQISVLVSGLNDPAGVAVDGLGNVYIADTGSNSIKQWSAATGQVTNLLSANLSSPSGLAVDAQGNLYLADTGDSAIEQITFAYLALSVSGLTEGPAAGTDSLAAQVLPAGTPLTAASDQPWLTVTGSSGGTIGFSFLANTSVNSRIAFLSILGEQVTLTQTGDTAADLVKISGDAQNTLAGKIFAVPLQVRVLDAGGNPLEGAGVSFTVTPGSGGAGAVFSSTPQMPILTDQKGTATAPTLTANNISGPFTVTASVNGVSAVFSLSVTGFVLETSSALVANTAGTGSVLLAGFGPWTATANASWLHLLPGSGSGIGSTSVQFSYDANPNAGIQTGTLTIAGLTFTVTQTGTAYTAIPDMITLVSGLSRPQAVAVDSLGNVYVADPGNNALFEWSFATQQVTSIVSSGLNAPSGVAVDGQGNLYIADSGNNAIEEWNAASQQLTTLVASSLANPGGVAVDPYGNVYIADTGNNAVKEWNAANQQVTVLVASGLAAPQGVTVDGLGNVYIADTGNHAIEQWNPVTGQLTVLAAAGLSAPTGIAVDGQGNVYISDAGNNAIDEWTAAGAQFSALIASGLNAPGGIALDAQGNIYVADTNDSVVKKLTLAYLDLGLTSVTEGPAAGTDSVVARILPKGASLQASSDQPWLTVTGESASSIFYGFQANSSVSSRVGHLTVLGYQITITQTGDIPAHVVKTAGDSQLALPGQVFGTSLQVTVTDARHAPVQGASVTFTVVPGAGGAAGSFDPTVPMPLTTDSNGNATAPALTANGIIGPFTVSASAGPTAKFSLGNMGYALATSAATVGSVAGAGSVQLIGYGPWTATSNASWLHIPTASASGSTGALIQFTFDANPNPAVQTGTLTIAGLTFTVTQAAANSVPVYPVTPWVTTGLNQPRGVAVDSAGNLYIADAGSNSIEQWSAATQQVTTLIGSGLNTPTGVAVDAAGNVYVADSGNNAIEEWNAGTQQMTPLLSSGLSNPSGVAVDSSGNVYIADTGNNAIEEWNATTQQLSVLVGTGLNVPSAVAVDAQGNVYIEDTGNNDVKQWSAATRQVTTLVSSGLNHPAGVAVDGQGNVSIADTGNSAVKLWSASSLQLTALLAAGLSGPSSIAADAQGNIYVADTNHAVIDRISFAYLAFGATSVTEGAASGADSLAIQVTPSNTPFTAVSDQPWLAIGSVSAGSIGFTFTANDSVTSRTAHIGVLGQQVTVTQSADTPAAMAKSGDGQLTPAGQAFAMPLAVAVTDPAGNPVSGSAVTFTIVPGPNGASGSFASTPPMPVLTDQNGNAAAPTLTANAIPGPFTVIAAAGGLTASFNVGNTGYALATASTLVGGGAGNSAVLLVGYGSWTATSNAPWLHLSVASGSAGGLVPFAYDANPNPGAQTGTLTIAGLTFTVSQAAANSVVVFPATKLVSTGLSLPRSVAVDAQGNAYIADTGHNSIKMWSAATKKVTVLVSTGLESPGGVALDALGNVYIADTGHNAVKQWNAATHHVTTLASGLSSPSGLAVDNEGNIYIADTGSNSVKEWNAATRQLSVVIATGLNAPAAVALDGQGNLYIADTGNNAVEEWNVATGQFAALVSSGLNAPAGVAVDGLGNVDIADTGNNAIKQWSPVTSQLAPVLSTGLTAPAGVAVDPLGNVYVADTNDSDIQRASAVYLALGATSLTESSSAGSDAVSVQVLPAATHLTATSNQSWLTISGISGGSIAFSFSANLSANSRTAHITVLGQQVTVTQSGDTPATIAKTAGNNESAPAGQPFPTALEVKIKDAAGNPVAGASVTFTVVPGTTGAGGSFSPAPPMPILTNASGIAKAPVLTAGNVAGKFTVQATANGLSTSFALKVTAH